MSSYPNLATQTKFERAAQARRLSYMAFDHHRENCKACFWCTAQEMRADSHKCAEGNRVAVAAFGENPK